MSDKDIVFLGGRAVPFGAFWNLKEKSTTSSVAAAKGSLRSGVTPETSTTPWWATSSVELGRVYIGRRVACAERSLERPHA